MNDHNPAQGQSGTHDLGPILGPHKGDPLSRSVEDDARKLVELSNGDLLSLLDTPEQMLNALTQAEARIAELERELSKYRGPSINPPCPVCPSSTPDQVIFSPVYGGNRHFYCKSCEQSFAGAFTYGPSELERRVQELTADKNRMDALEKMLKQSPKHWGFVHIDTLPNQMQIGACNEHHGREAGNIIARTLREATDAMIAGKSK